LAVIVEGVAGKNDHIGAGRARGIQYFLQD